MHHNCGASFSESVLLMYRVQHIEMNLDCDVHRTGCISALELRFAMQSQSWTLRLYDVAAAARFSQLSLRGHKRMEPLLPDFGNFKLFGATIHDDNIDVFSIPVKLGDRLILSDTAPHSGESEQKRKSDGSHVIVRAARYDRSVLMSMLPSGLFNFFESDYALSVCGV